MFTPLIFYVTIIKRGDCVPKKPTTKANTYENYKDEMLTKERHALVVKAQNLIQKTRYSLTTQEQKIVLYVLSKISPEDTAFKEYRFNIQHFCDVCGIKDSNYEYLKKTMQGLRRKNFWITITDSEGKEAESCVDWFSVVRVYKNSGVILMKFHEDLHPFLLELREKFVKYPIFPTLAMKSRYSIRLYELLKSYDNLSEWWFDIPTLKKKLFCTNYDKYADFRRFVIEPAIKEINQFTDLHIAYESIKDGSREYSKIRFYIDHKTIYENILASNEVNQVLEGQMSLLEDTPNENS